MGRVNLHESKFVILAFQFYLLFQTFTSVQQYLSISFQDSVSADNCVKSQDFIYLGHRPSSKLTEPGELYHFQIQKFTCSDPMGEAEQRIPSLPSSFSLSSFLTTYAHHFSSLARGKPKNHRTENNRDKPDRLSGEDHQEAGLFNTSAVPWEHPFCSLDITCPEVPALLSLLNIIAIN